MPVFIGFNTQNQFKKFTLTDADLVKRDFVNALNIKQGTLPGRPQYGTVIWDNLFENQGNQVTTAIENELQRVGGGDPRLQIISTEIFPQENGILLQVEIQIVPSTESERLRIFFDNETRVATYV